MAKSGKSSKYSVLCVAVALGCSLFGILFGVSLNLNSHDVLASYRSSMTTLAQNNAMLSDITVSEWDRLQDHAIEKEDSALFYKVSDLSDASVMKKSILKLGALSISLLSLALLFKIMHWPGGNTMLILTLGGLVPLTAFLTASYLGKEEDEHNE